MENAIIDELKDLHKDIEEIKRAIQELKEIILPTEKIPKEKLIELKRLEKDEMKEYIEWNEDLDVFK